MTTDQQDRPHLSTPRAVLLAGGGTAGHVNPLLAVADELRRREPEMRLLALGTAEGLEARLVPERGLDLRTVPKVPLPRRPTADWFRLHRKLKVAVDAAAAAIEEIDAQAVVGFGGYVSTPAYLAARSAGVPVVVHEQNARPGLANRLGSRWAQAVAITFPGTRLRGAQVTGLPLRPEIAGLLDDLRADAAGTRRRAAAELGFDPDRVTLLVTGGSLGALSVNRAISAQAGAVLSTGAQVLHLTGTGKAEEVRAAVRGVPGAERYHVREYLGEMEQALAVADLVVCRAGAGTVGELAALGIPAVYVPLPVGNGEQRLNAQPVVDAGGGVLVADEQLTADWIDEHLLPLLEPGAEAERAEMGRAAAGVGVPDATARVADLVQAAVDGERTRRAEKAQEAAERAALAAEQAAAGTVEDGTPDQEAPVADDETGGAAATDDDPPTTTGPTTAATGTAATGATDATGRGTWRVSGPATGPGRQVTSRRGAGTGTGGTPATSAATDATPTAPVEQTSPAPAPVPSSPDGAPARFHPGGAPAGDDTPAVGTVPADETTVIAAVRPDPREIADFGRVHLVGIGGAGMSAVAGLLVDRGLAVQGSDAQEGPALAGLRDLGVQVTVGLDTALVDQADTVVVSSAVRPSHPEVVRARQLGLPVLHRSRALAALMSDRIAIAVAGAHGKTTTSAMIATALTAVGRRDPLLDPSYAIGGNLRTADGPLPGFRSGRGQAFVAEADESDGSFLAYAPAVAVVTNVEPDHLDHYRSVGAFEQAFVDFASRVRDGGALVTCADDAGAVRMLAAVRDPLGRRGVRVLTYGHGEDADLQIGATVASGGRWRTPLVSHRDGLPGATLELQVPGEHNAADAAAAYLAAWAVGADMVEVVVGLSEFAGTGRRFEDRGTADGVRVVDDYAHHPTEVVALLRTARTLVGDGRVVVLFQPHLFSRTATFAGEFAAALSLADDVVVTDVYAAREDPDPDVTGDTIVRAAPSQGRLRFVADRQEAARAAAATARPGDLLLTVGAGDVTALAPVVLAELAARQPGGGPAPTEGP